MVEVELLATLLSYGPRHGRNTMALLMSTCVLVGTSILAHMTTSSRIGESQEIQVGTKRLLPVKLP